MAALWRTPGRWQSRSTALRAICLWTTEAFGVVSVFTIQSNGGLVYSNTFACFAVEQRARNRRGQQCRREQRRQLRVLPRIPMSTFCSPLREASATLTHTIERGRFQRTHRAGRSIRRGLFAYTGNSGSGTIALLGLRIAANAGAGRFA